MQKKIYEDTIRNCLIKTLTLAQTSAKAEFMVITIILKNNS